MVRKPTPRRLTGEVKVAISIRMLAGGFYRDLVPLFGPSTAHLYTVFDNFIVQILETFHFPLVPWLRERNWTALQNLASLFAEKTDGVFYGPFGALDGLAVCIRSPTLTDVPDPGNYFCRKGFYALNVQAICDKRLRFLWIFPSSKGSTHDATAFRHSRLMDLLKELSPELAARGLFMSVDSAYQLTPFLQCPYGQALLQEDMNGMRDAFNFYLSSCRIYIECAFGELVMCWGIFWRTLRFDLKKCMKTINVAMLLQNFIIEHRKERSSDIEYFSNFNVASDEQSQALVTDMTGEAPEPLVTDNNEPRVCGRRTQEDNELEAEGFKLREFLTVNLAVNGMERPMQHDMQ